MCRFLSISFEKARTIACEGYITLRHVLPLSLTWLYQRYVTHQIIDVALSDKAFLYQHGNDKKRTVALLLVHGDYGHPFNLLHLAHEAQKEKFISVFSLYLPNSHQNERLRENSACMKRAIDKIQKIVGRKVLIAAHSKGSILAAERILIKRDARIQALFAVGGRFHLPPSDESCKPLLRPLIRRISSAIHERGYVPEIISIAPKEDWNAPQAAMKDGLPFYSVDGGHLGGLYETKTKEHFRRFCRVQSLLR